MVSKDGSGGAGVQHGPAVALADIHEVSLFGIRSLGRVGLDLGLTQS